MAQPSKKALEIEKFLDEQSKAMTGRTRTESIKGDICSWCGGPAIKFKDALSRKEYAISGFCRLDEPERPNHYSRPLPKVCR